MSNLLYFLRHHGIISSRIFHWLFEHWEATPFYHKPDPIPGPWEEGCRFIFHFFFGGGEYMKMGDRPRLNIPFIAGDVKCYYGSMFNSMMATPRFSALHLDPSAIIYPGGERRELNID